MKNLHKNIGIFASSLLVTASAVYIYSPVIGSHADSSATAEISVNVADVMALSLDTNELNLSSNPNNFVSGTINATVSTNSQYGYTLALEDVDSNTNLVHANENISDAISSSFSGSKTSSEMEANTWGFSLNSTDFFKVPANGSPVALKRTTTPMTTETETTPVDFGVKLGNITSGKYSDSVLFTMYVNGQDGKPTDPTGQTNPSDPSNPGEDTSSDTRTLADIETLQDIYASRGGTPVVDLNDTDNTYKKSKICENTPIGASKVLRDSRDGNEYKVTRLIDGKCWMVENLRLTNKTIHNTDSNIAADDFVIPASIDNWNASVSSSMVYYNSEAPENGAYYNYYAASAGTVHDYGSDSELEATQSICPIGWRLPSDADWLAVFDGYGYAGNSDELHLNTVDLRNALQEPVSLTMSGYHNYSGSDISGLGTDGYFWDSTANGSERKAAWIEVGTWTYLHQGANNMRHRGFNIRCVAGV